MDSKQTKLNRMRAALTFQEADRVPISDWFWTGFRKKCIAKWGADFDPYTRWDLDYITCGPNMDPEIKDFEIIEQKGEDVVVKTGFGATIRRRSDLPMPHYEEFSVAKPEDMESFVLEDPADPRRFFKAGEDQLNCVGDALALGGIPSWNERLDAVCNQFPTFGTVCDPYEYFWRCVGSVNALEWMALEPEMTRDFLNRIGEWMLELLKAQIKYGAGRLSGIIIWGDVAYTQGMFFGPVKWRELFKPHVKALIDCAHENGLLTIYHGCGKVLSILDDYAEIKLGGYNPLEVKAGQDIVELKAKYHNKLAFVGNMDVRELETNDPRRVKREVLYKLQAAQGGGWVCQSDHSISTFVDPESYELVISLIHEYGRYPLDMEKLKAEIATLDQELKG